MARLQRWLLSSAMAACCWGAAIGRAGEPTRIPVVFHVARAAGEPVAPASFIAGELAAANTIYAPLGIELVERESVPLAEAHAELISRADRDALAPYVGNGAIHCFIVGKLMDVDEPGRERRGVHWHPRAKPSQSYLIVSKISGPYVLAHETGHMLGNPQHSDVPGNLMSYTRSEGTPFLDATQIARVRRTLAALIKAGRVVPMQRKSRGEN